MANWLSFASGKLNSPQVLCFDLTKQETRNKMGGGVGAWLAHDTPSIVAKMISRIFFWGAKV